MRFLPMVHADLDCSIKVDVTRSKFYGKFTITAFELIKGVNVMWQKYLISYSIMSLKRMWLIHWFVAWQYYWDEKKKKMCVKS